MAALAPSLVPGAAPAPAIGPGLRRLPFFAMGTSCEVQYATSNPGTGDVDLEQAVLSWVGRFEQRYSRFLPDSLVSRINAAAGSWVQVDAETEQLFALCDTIHEITSGVLDPTILPLLRLWNWKSSSPVVPEAAAVRQACAFVGWRKVQRAPGRVLLPVGMALDFGGFGKEYAVDMVAELIRQHGVTAALVDFGHDLRVLGTPPGRPAWHIGLEDPRQPGVARGSLALSGNAGVASSGDYVRCFRVGEKRYGHIIDPRSGYPVANGMLQATVVASSCLQAGVLSTAAFVLGVPHGIDFIQGYPRAEGLLTTESVRAQTRGFHAYVAH